MKVLKIKSGKLTVGAIVKHQSDSTDTCPLLEQMYDVQANQEASRDRLLNYIDLVARGGLSALNSSQFHLVDRSNKIYEFIAGDLRLLFFQANSGSFVICSNMFLKKTQKTPPQEVAKAVKAKVRYEQASATWIEDLK